MPQSQTIEQQKTAQGRETAPKIHKTARTQYFHTASSLFLARCSKNMRRHLKVNGYDQEILHTVG